MNTLFPPKHTVLMETTIIKDNIHIFSCNTSLSGSRKSMWKLQALTATFSFVCLCGCAESFDMSPHELEDMDTSTAVYLDEDPADTSLGDGADTGEVDSSSDFDNESDSTTDFDTEKDTEIPGEKSGTLDDRFGNKGKFLFPSALGNDSAIDAVTTPDGSIFITGKLSNGTDSDLLLMKLTRNGVLDTTFNGTGYITRHNIAGGNGGDTGFSIHLAPDGDLLIAGGSLGPGEYALGLLWKVSTSGTSDASFGTAGTYLLDMGANMLGITAMYDSKTGKIFAVGEIDWLIYGFRILANGSGLDMSFSSDGAIELYPKKSIHPVLNVLSDGTLLVAGTCQAGGGGWDACSWLVDTNGNLITNYTNYSDQTRGHADLAGGNGSDSWNAVLPYPQNRLVLAGASESVSNSQDELIARVNISDGSFDTSFGGGDGIWTEDVLGLRKLGRVHKVIVKQDGSIVAALEVITDAGDWDVAVIKLHANGVRDMSFADGTGVLQLGGAYEDRHPNIIEHPDGRTLVFTSQYNDKESDIVMWAVL